MSFLIVILISLIIEIARIIGMFLLEKRMSYDIMNNLLKKTKNNEEYKNNISNSINNNNFNKKNNNKILSQSTTNNNLNLSKNTELNLNSETIINDKILDKTFESINYFYRVFKASIGVTPSQYRANTQHKYDHRK